MRVMRSSAVERHARDDVVHEHAAEVLFANHVAVRDEHAPRVEVADGEGEHHVRPEDHVDRRVGKEEELVRANRRVVKRGDGNPHHVVQDAEEDDDLPRQLDVRVRVDDAALPNARAQRLLLRLRLLEQLHTLLVRILVHVRHVAERLAVVCVACVLNSVKRSCLGVYRVRVRVHCACWGGGRRTAPHGAK
jgi:hypothetical protein